MGRIDIYYVTYHLSPQNVVPTLPGYKVIKSCDKYKYSHTNKPIFYPFNYYDRSNIIRITSIGNQIVDYNTKLFLE